MVQPIVILKENTRARAPGSDIANLYMDPSAVISFPMGPSVGYSPVNFGSDLADEVFNKVSEADKFVNSEEQTQTTNNGKDIFDRQVQESESSSSNSNTNVAAYQEAEITQEEYRSAYEELEGQLTEINPRTRARVFKPQFARNLLLFMNNPGLLEKALNPSSISNPTELELRALAVIDGARSHFNDAINQSANPLGGGNSSAEKARNIRRYTAALDQLLNDYPVEGRTAPNLFRAILETNVRNEGYALENPDGTATAVNTDNVEQLLSYNPQLTEALTDSLVQARRGIQNAVYHAQETLASMDEESMMGGWDLLGFMAAGYVGSKVINQGGRLIVNGTTPYQMQATTGAWGKIAEGSSWLKDKVRHGPGRYAARRLQENTLKASAAEIKALEKFITKNTNYTALMKKAAFQSYAESFMTSEKVLKDLSAQAQAAVKNGLRGPDLLKSLTTADWDRVGPQALKQYDRLLFSRVQKAKFERELISQARKALTASSGDVLANVNAYRRVVNNPTQYVQQLGSATDDMGRIVQKATVNAMQIADEVSVFADDIGAAASRAISNGAAAVSNSAQAAAAATETATKAGLAVVDDLALNAGKTVAIRSGATGALGLLRGPGAILGGPWGIAALVAFDVGATIYSSVKKGKFDWQGTTRMVYDGLSWVFGKLTGGSQA